MFVQQINQPLLIVDGHAGFLRFCQLGTGVLADDQVAERFAHAGGDGPAQLDDEFFGGRTRHTVEAAGKQECLPCQWPIQRAPFLSHVQACLAQPLDELPAPVVLQPGVQAVPDDGANAGRLDDLFLAGGQ